MSTVVPLYPVTEALGQIQTPAWSPSSCLKARAKDEANKGEQLEEPCGFAAWFEEAY